MFSLSCHGVDTVFSENQLSSPTVTVINLIRQKKYSKASEMLEKLLEKSPEAAELWFLSGSCARGEGNLGKAGESLEKALKLDPGHMKARFNLALLRSVPGGAYYDLPRAITDMEKILSENPDMDLALFHLGSFCRRNLRFEKAEEHLLETRKRMPGDWRPYKELYLLYIGLDEYEKAENILEEAKSRFPKKPDWEKIEFDNVLRQVKRFMLDYDYEKAEPLLLSLKEKFPENPEIIFLEAFILQEKGEVNRAGSLYRSIAEEEDFTDRVYLNLARMYVLEGIRLGEAKELLRKLQKKNIQPTWETQSLWMIIHTREGDLEVADNNLKIATGILEYYPEKPEMSMDKKGLPEDFRAAAAFLEFKKGNTEKALEWLEDIKPDRNSILYRFVKRLKEKIERN